jgi:small-conductance mechanosensitive channel
MDNNGVADGTNVVQMLHMSHVNKAILYGYLFIPTEFARAIESLGLILSSYLLASLFLKITSNKILNVFAINVHAEHKILLGKIYSIGVYSFTTLIVFWELGVTMENIAIVLGLSATGIAFAIRDFILSYLVWFILLTKRPFKIGDYIRIGEDEGVVQHIGTFHVLLNHSPTAFEDYIRIPNKLFLEKSVYNMGRSKIPLIVTVPIKNPTVQISKKMVKLNKELSKFCNDGLEIFLSSDKENFVLRIETLAEPTKKDYLRSKITIIALEHLLSK